MHNPYEQPHAAPNDPALSAEMKEWTTGIRYVFATLNVFPMYYCGRVLLAAPRFQAIFEDMLGSKDKLPLLTQLVLRWSLPLLVLMSLLAVFALVLIFTLRRARFVWVTAALSAFVFIASGHLVATVLMDPLVSVIQNLTGGGETP